MERRHADWQRRRRLLAQGLHDWQPDVIALQEVVRCEDYDGVRELLGEGWHVAAHPRWSEDGAGAAVAGRWPITAVRTDTFDGVGREAMAEWCGVTVAEVQAPSPFGTMMVVHHEPSWERGQEREREAQAVAAARLVVAMVGAGHVVLLGDFDAAPCAVLDGPAVVERPECVLPRRMGDGSSGRAGSYLLPCQPSRKTGRDA
ncbi:endonuclease/exonuclease/phosphatase family protein [Streptomyces bluensis]